MYDILKSDPTIITGNDSSGTAFIIEPSCGHKFLSGWGLNLS
jgi:hypothetical protein